MIAVRAARLLTACIAMLSPAAHATAQSTSAPPSTSTPAPAAPAGQTPPNRDYVFDMGEIEVVGRAEDGVGLGGGLVTRDQIWTFDRRSLDQAVNVIPGVVSTFDSNGRRNESDIFVRGFGRWQVPLMVDGVRIYLPADNRLDFSRFLTADIAEVQIQKGYASVLDGPGAMGGAINLVTRKPAAPFEAEASVWTGGRSDLEGWNGSVMVGTRQPRYYLQGSANYADRDYWTLSGNFTAPGTSLQTSDRRLSSDTSDSRFNLKGGWTPNATDEYTVNFIKQLGEKGAPLNVYNNPPVPPNSFWRWPYWDVQNLSFLSKTQLGQASYVRTTWYYNTFANGLDAFDNATYTTQSLPGRFHSPYDDHAYGLSAEFGTTQGTANTLKAALHYRTDVHREQQTSRPTHPTLRSEEPLQEQAQNTWSIALENTYRPSDAVDIVGGISVEEYEVTKAEDFNAGGLFEFPRGGAEAFNWQAAVIWRYAPAAQLHASVSDRARFPILFELYSTRFGFATPNPDLGPERATNLAFGWSGQARGRMRLAGTVFYSDVRDLIQTVLLPDTTTQTQNVGDGEFYGVEISTDLDVAPRLSIGGNYTAITRTVVDPIQPNLRPTGVPTSKAFLYASWRPIDALTITPSLDVAGDRWSDINPPPDPAFPFIRTGSYAVLDVAAQYRVRPDIDVVFGLKNLTDDSYELSWGFPQPGRTFYLKTRVGL